MSKSREIKAERERERKWSKTCGWINVVNHFGCFSGRYINGKEAPPFFNNNGKNSTFAPSHTRRTITNNRLPQTVTGGQRQKLETNNEAHRYQQHDCRLALVPRRKQHHQRTRLGFINIISFQCILRCMFAFVVVAATMCF